MKSQLVEKDSDAGKDQSQKEKGLAEDDVFGWHHQLNGHKHVSLIHSKVVYWVHAHMPSQFCHV